MVTIKQKIDKLRGWIEREEPHSPGQWLDEAMEISVLQQDLQDARIKADIEFEESVISILDKNEKMKKNEAESRAKIDKKISSFNKDMTVYEYMRYLDNRNNVITSIIQIAKKRAEVRE